MPPTIQKTLKPSKYRAVDTSTSEQETYDIQTDGAFNGADDTNWSTGTASSISGGYAIVSDSGGNSGNIVQGFNAGLTKGAGARGIKQGDRYRVQMVVEDPDSGTFDGRVRVALYSESPGGVGGDNFRGFSSYLTSAGTVDQIVTVSQTNTGNYHDSIVIENTSDPCNFKIASIKVTKLESFGNNNHGQIYSGRGLEFDGNSDYLTVPKGDASQPTDHLTIASWVYIDSTASSWQTIYASTAGWGEGIWCAFDGNENMVLDLQDVIAYPNTRTSGGVIETNTWYRAVWTFTTNASTSFTIRMYLNGVLIKEVTEADGVHENIQSINQENHDMMIGGARVSDPQYLLNGKLSDFQIWHKAWTQDEVTFDYLNPESLALNSGGSTLTESDLQIWYPMQDGHRGQQSYIMDGANTGLGSELCTNAEMNPNGAGWQFNNKWEGIANDTYVSTTNPSTDSDESAFYTTFQGKQVLFLKTSNASSNEIVDQSIAVLSGVTYKFHIRAWIVSGQLKAYQSNANFEDNIFQRSSTTGQWEDIIGYLTCDSSGNAGFNVGVNDGGNVECYIDFASAKPVNDNHHATTVFLGDEMVLGDDNDMDTVGNWVGAGGGSVSIVDDSANDANRDSVLRIDASSTSADRAELPQANLRETTIAGRTYRIEFLFRYVDNTDMTGDSYVNVGGTLVTNLDRTATSWTTYTNDIVATDNSTNIRIYVNGGSGHANNAILIDNVSIKEVGVASGWTDADQQLDIPQTALQSYNQLAWATDTGESVEISNHSDFSFTTGSAD